MTSGGGRRRAVVFELDGTLVAGDSSGGFSRSLPTRSPVRPAPAVLTSCGAALGADADVLRWSPGARRGAPGTTA